MAKNKVQDGKVLPLTSAGAVSSGGVVVSGALVGIALNDIAAGERGQCAMDGVWTLPKAAEALTEGAAVYWDGAAVTATATANDAIGHVVDEAASGDATCNVKLPG